MEDDETEIGIWMNILDQHIIQLFDAVEQQNRQQKINFNKINNK